MTSSLGEHAVHIGQQGIRVGFATVSISNKAVSPQTKKQEAFIKEIYNAYYM